MASEEQPVLRAGLRADLLAMAPSAQEGFWQHWGPCSRPSRPLALADKDIKRAPVRSNLPELQGQSEAGAFRGRSLHLASLLGAKASGSSNWVRKK